MSDDVFKLYVIETPGGCYIGCTVRSIAHRWAGHTEFNGWRPPSLEGRPTIAEALAVFGKANCTIRHIASARTVEDARACETALILQYNSVHPNGFNRRASSGYTEQRGRVHWTKTLRPWQDPNYRPRDFIRIPSRSKLLKWPPSASEAA